MGTAERRMDILRILCRRRYETIPNLACEFGVSIRTILRDIEILSATAPIYTQCGRHGGGVYVMENYSMDRMYMHKNELEVLHRLETLAEHGSACNLNEREKEVLRTIISQYTKPTG